MKILSKPIKMIAWFNDNGNINPIKFQIQEDGNRVVKIDRVIKKEQEKLAGNIMEKFTCVSNINGAEKIYEVKYDSKSYKWILYKY